MITPLLFSMKFASEKLTHMIVFQDEGNIVLFHEPDNCGWFPYKPAFLLRRYSDDTGTWEFRVDKEVTNSGFTPISRQPPTVYHHWSFQGFKRLNSSRTNLPSFGRRLAATLLRSSPVSKSAKRFSAWLYSSNLSLYSLYIYAYTTIYMYIYIYIDINVTVYISMNPTLLPWKMICEKCHQSFGLFFIVF